MKKVTGLWIDNKKSVLFSLSDEGASIKRIPSEAKSEVRDAGGKQTKAVSEESGSPSNGHLSQYYDEVLSHIRDAESIFIFGPGDAKHEIKKRLEKVDLHGNIVGFETVEKMTDNQIITKIRRRFLT
jgi:hypothetical protein